MLLDLGNEPLVPLGMKRRQVVGHVTGEQHISLGPPHQETGVSGTVCRRRQRSDRTVLRHWPTRRKAQHRRSVEVEETGNEASWHRGGQEAQQPGATGYCEVSHRGDDLPIIAGLGTPQIEGYVETTALVADSDAAEVDLLE